MAAADPFGGDEQVRKIVRDELCTLGLLDQLNDPKSLGEQIRQARRQAGLTQEQFAELAGVSHHTIHAMEADNRRVLPRELARIVALLGKRIVLVNVSQEVPHGRG